MGTERRLLLRCGTLLTVAKLLKRFWIKQELIFEIIPGEEEARILYEGILNTGKSRWRAKLYADRCGRVEVRKSIFFVKGKRVDWKSFNLGTVRLKEGLQQEGSWEEFDTWIQQKVKEYKPHYAVGTGGNINKLYKLCGRKDWETLSDLEMSDKLDYLKQFTPEEMISTMDIKPDRADVILHGGAIYLRAMQQGGIKEMIVPKVGLADGLIRQLYLDDQEA